MSLEQMNLLEQGARCEEQIANEALSAQALLADVRKGDRSLSDALVDLHNRWNYGANEVARNELYTAINRFSHDILRIAEMTLSARARGPDAHSALVLADAALSAYHKQEPTDQIQ